MLLAFDSSRTGSRCERKERMSPFGSLLKLKDPWISRSGLSWILLETNTTGDWSSSPYLKEDCDDEELLSKILTRTCSMSIGASTGYSTLIIGTLHKGHST
jgi:hypothetical protein